MRPRRIALVAGGFLGFPHSGGMGTATSFLAISLARSGHSVEIVCVRPNVDYPIEPQWRDVLARERVGIRLVTAPADVEPDVLALPIATLDALRDAPPDVAIVQDWGGYGFAALTMRELGLAFSETLFVMYTHGSRRWIAEAHGKLPDSPESVLMAELESATAELADAVVSPSRYLLGWMRGRGWALPDRSLAVPLLTEGALFGGAAQPLAASPVSRIAYFGRVEDRKGIQPFLRAVAGLGHARLARLELHLLGSASVAWTPERLAGELGEAALASLRGFEAHTALTGTEALALLRRPGTLAVIPSLDDNSPNTVYECLEAGVPMIASAVGGIPELVADEDRERVLFEPSPAGVRAALERALDTDTPFAAARPAFDAVASARAWEDVVQGSPRGRSGEGTGTPLVTAVVAASDSATVDRALAGLARQRTPPLETIVVRAQGGGALDGVRVLEAPGASTWQAWQGGAREARGDWVLLLTGDDEPGENVVDVLVWAAAASNADAVTCGLRDAPRAPCDVCSREARPAASACSRTSSGRWDSCAGR